MEKTLTMLIRLGQRPYGLPYWLPPKELAKIDKAEILALPIRSLDVSERALVGLEGIFSSKPNEAFGIETPEEANLEWVLGLFRNPSVRWPSNFADTSRREVIEALKRLGMDVSGVE